MPADVLMEPREIPTSEQRLLAGAERRIMIAMAIAGVSGFIGCWLWGGMRTAGGYAVGAALSALNLRGFISAANTLSALATAGQSDRRVRRPVRLAIRLLLRYALIAGAGYVIFKGSFFSLGAFFVGLFLFLGAILGEVAYEIYFACRCA